MTLAGAILALSLAATPASAAEDWFDLSVHGGLSLERSILAMNEELQQRYNEDDRLAALADPRPRDFATTAIVSSQFPETETVADIDAPFGTPISDGASLNANVEVLNYTLATLGDDLFLQIVADATRERHSFATVAQVIDDNNAIAQYQYALLAEDREFGTPVHNGASLDNSITGLNQFIGEIELRETLLAGAVPAITGARMDRYLAEAHLLY